MMALGDDSRLQRAGAVLTIDLAALQSNYRTLRERAGDAECAAVVKADAYGIGIEPAVKALMAAGCRTFFVALLDEAARVRACSSDVTVYVLGGLFPGTGADFVAIDARPVLNSLAEISEWSAFARAHPGAPAAAIHIDTAMNRLGLPADELYTLIGAPGLLEGIEVALVMSHLACADVPEDPVNEAQRSRFELASRAFERATASLANSGGILNGPGYRFGMVRAGIALYGGNPVPAGPSPVVPVVTLSGLVAQVRDVEAGATVGYGATYRFDEPARVATVAVGYADGYFRHLSRATGADGAEAVIDGQRVPVVGRVSMDSLALDVTGLDPQAAVRGAHVELIGPSISIDEIAAKAGTIGYEVLTSLGSRFARVYSGLDC